MAHDDLNALRRHTGTFFRRPVQLARIGGAGLTKKSRWWRTAVPLLGATFAVLNLASPAGAQSHSAAVAEAKKALLVLSDFPKGWTTSPSGKSSALPRAANLASCLGVPVKVLTYNPPEASSPAFNENSKGFSVNDQVSIFPTAAVAAKQFDLFGSSKTPRCLARYFNTASSKAQLAKAIGAGAQIGAVSSRWLPPPSISDKATMLAVQIPVTYQATKLTISLVVVTILAKLSGAQLTFSSASSLPPSLQAHLIAVTVQRLG